MRDDVCGIVASVSRDRGASRAAIERALARLRHRGPDAQQAWIAPNGRAALGCARLRIIDLRGGDQPIASEDGRLRIVVNGELYGFERLRRELERQGHRFATRSDSEVALHLYEDLGARALRALRGEFAFAIWDERDQLLFAARDRFGVKPLYYAVHGATVHLASEIKALAALGVPLRWDPDALYDVHFISYSPDRTLFAGVHQLPPGHYLVTDGSQLRVLPYWDWDYPLARENGDSSPREWVERLKEALEEAVRLRLRADVPVGCYLSGGLDSCATLGLAAGCFPGRLRAYTVSFDHPDYDEVDIASEQAERSGAELCRVDVGSEDLAEHFTGAIYHAECPIGNAHAIAKYLLSRAVRRSGVKVVLTGEGSDEILAGYPHFRRDLVLHEPNGNDAAGRARLLAELQAVNRVSAGTLLPSGAARLDSVERILGYVPSHLEVWAQFGATLTAMLRPDFSGAFAGRDPYRVMLGCLDLERQLRGRSTVNQSLYLWGKTMLPNYILSSVGDRMEMAHSVEGRLPFMDHEVASVVAEMPVELKIHGMTEKYALREAARPLLTHTVYWRQKHPFMSPPATLQEDGALFTFLQDTLRGSSLDGPGIYDRAKVVALLDSVPSIPLPNRSAADFALMWMTSICLLHGALGVGA